MSNLAKRCSPLTPNLRFIGTVNVDETTHGFADKVYDRAQLIELEASREAIQHHLANSTIAKTLLTAWDALHEVAPFAFRVIDDMRNYVAAAEGPRAWKLTQLSMSRCFKSCFPRFTA